MPTIYLDYNATTPLDPDVRAAMLPFLGPCFGNPSSIHHLGRTARAHLDAARQRAADVLTCKPSELTFTSGGTESNNLAILGVARSFRHRGRHLITSPTEHPAVLHTFEFLVQHEGFELSLLPVDSFGRVNPDDVASALRDSTVLVSVMAANNETGTLQPVSEIGRLCRNRGVLFHTDAVQVYGKEPLPNIANLEADLVSLCSHKLHGPKGVGALYTRSPLRTSPLFHGGSQENERRPGTENLAAIEGFVMALEKFVQPPVFPTKLRTLTEQLRSGLCLVDGVTSVSPEQGRLCNTVSFTAAGCDSLSLIAALDLEGICASSGSACSAGSLEPSHVLLAQGYDRASASSFVRFSLGRESSAEEINFLLALWPEVVRRIRKFGS